MSAEQVQQFNNFNAQIIARKQELHHSMKMDNDIWSNSFSKKTVFPFLHWSIIDQAKNYLVQSLEPAIRIERSSVMREQKESEAFDQKMIDVIPSTEGRVRKKCC